MRNRFPLSVIVVLAVGLVACTAVSPSVVPSPVSAPGPQGIQLVSERQIAAGEWETFSWSPDSAWMVLSLPERLPDGHPRDGKLAIVSVPDGELRMIPQAGLYPVWSPDSRAVLFTSTDGSSGTPRYWLYWLSDDRVRSLADLPGAPLLWAPDGRVFLRALDGLWTVHVDISSPAAVTVNAAQRVLAFDWRDERRWVLPAPDGSSIMLYDGTIENDRHMWMVALDGSRVEFEQPRGSIGACCVWAPTGSMFAFFSPNPVSGIYVVDSTGRNRRQVLQATTIGKGYLISLTLSPDGRVIALEWSPEEAGDPFQKGEIFLVNVDGTGLQQLTPESSKQHQWLRWSPDGRYIAFGRESLSVWVAELSYSGPRSP